MIPEQVGIAHVGLQHIHSLVPRHVQPISSGMLARSVRTDGFVDPCIPTRAAKAAVGPGWVPSPRRPANRARSITMDGEAVVVGADGVAVFDALHRRHKGHRGDPGASRRAG